MKPVWKILTNKFVFVGLAFLAWMLFFDQNDYRSIKEKKKELEAIEGNIAYLNSEILRMSTEKEALLHDPNRIEQFARENFRMKHEGEDVYVVEVVDKKKDK